MKKIKYHLVPWWTPQNLMFMANTFVLIVKEVMFTNAYSMIPYMPFACTHAYKFEVFLPIILILLCHFLFSTLFLVHHFMAMENVQVDFLDLMKNIASMDFWEIEKWKLIEFIWKMCKVKKLMTLKNLIIEFNIVVNVEYCDEIQIECKWWCLQSINLIYLKFL